MFNDILKNIMGLMKMVHTHKCFSFYIVTGIKIEASVVQRLRDLA